MKERLIVSFFYNHALLLSLLLKSGFLKLNRSPCFTFSKFIASNYINNPVNSEILVGQELKEMQVPGTVYTFNFPYAITRLLGG